VILNPFLHFTRSDSLAPSRTFPSNPPIDAFAFLQRIRDDRDEDSTFEPHLTEPPDARRWLILADADLSHKYCLQQVSIECPAVCNQRCFFCPVSVHTKKRHLIPDDLSKPMDRARNMAVSQKPKTPQRGICGWEKAGSRPYQWFHAKAHFVPCSVSRILRSAM